MHNEDGYDESYEFTAPQRRFMRTDLVVLGLNLAVDVVDAIHTTLSMAQALAAAHANYKTAQEAFRTDAALQIESMTTGDSDG